MTVSLLITKSVYHKRPRKRGLIEKFSLFQSDRSDVAGGCGKFELRIFEPKFRLAAGSLHHPVEMAQGDAEVHLLQIPAVVLVALVLLFVEVDQVAADDDFLLFYELDGYVWKDNKTVITKGKLPGQLKQFEIIDVTKTSKKKEEFERE